MKSKNYLGLVISMALMFSVVSLALAECPKNPLTGECWKTGIDFENPGLPSIAGGGSTFQWPDTTPSCPTCLEKPKCVQRGNSCCLGDSCQSINIDCASGYHAEYYGCGESCNPQARCVPDPETCAQEGESVPVVPGAPECCAGLSKISCTQPDSEGNCPEFCVGASICANCGNGVCGLGENKCNCPEDCTDTPACAEEGEHFSMVFSEYPDHCCPGLTEWMSGMDTRKVVDGVCVETGLAAGSPVGTCINCGNGICESIENVCNCPQDCGETECAENGEIVYGIVSFGPTECCGPTAGIKPNAFLDPVNGYCMAPNDGSRGTCVEGWDVSCGNGVCGAGEDKCNCPADCPASECVPQGGVTYYGEENCCPGLTAISNDFPDPATGVCTGGTDDSRRYCEYCGDGICASLFDCAPGMDCGTSYENKCNCPEDCGETECLTEGQTWGAAVTPYSPEPIPCCGGLQALSLTLDPSNNCRPKVGWTGYVCTTKCGNGVCDGKENKCNCPADCTSKVECPAPKTLRPGTSCAQYRVYAKNPTTGKCCFYGNPCSAPSGWTTHTSLSSCQATSSALSLDNVFGIISSIRASIVKPTATYTQPFLILPFTGTN
ncbi:MAG: hypothetical protein JW727_03215 [Candidatus Aenigmarchaeota archaeon]|nr:hypothetical protein [Candidatus Aenigmarchaeota archaeon]